MGALVCLPEDVYPCAILPLGLLHTDPVRLHLGSWYAAVGGAHQSDRNPTLDVSARLTVGFFPLSVQATEIMERGVPWATPSLLCKKWTDTSPVSLTTRVA